MKSYRSITQGLILCACLTASFVAAAEQESIELDANGDYVITYQSYAGLWRKVIWVPSTKINPELMWSVRAIEPNPDQMRYRYTVRNGKDSIQFLVGLLLTASNVLSSDTDQPAGWIGGASLNRAAGAGYIVGWHFRRYGGSWEAGIRPGTTVSGFGFASHDLPGVGKVEFGGARRGGQGFPDEGPRGGTPVYEEFNRINENDFVPRLAAVPRVSVPSPYDATTVMANIKSHLDTDLVSLKLVDASFVTELDRWLDAAIAAAKGGNSKALRSAIQEARRLLKQEYPDIDRENDEDEADKGKKRSSRVDRLAAWVLDFDLRYVERRIPGAE